MSAIKRFFEKRKLDVKFKRAGGGHKLTEETRCSSASHPQPSSSVPRQQPKGAALTAAQQSAAEAALQRQTSRDRPSE